MRSALKKRATAILFGVLIVVAFLVWRGALARTTLLEVHVLDVGQGDAIFIEFPDGMQLLIDGGPDATVLSELAEVMPPFDRTIDVVVLTHPDADHLAGVIDVLRRYEVAMIVETGIRKDTALSRAWGEAVSAEGAQMVFADNRKRIRFGEIAVLDILWPQESHVGETLGSPNNYAIVARLTYGETTFLFSSDIERWAEGRLLASGVLQDTDVLKLAHHGSKTSTSEAFLDAVTPGFAVVSVGEENRYGHPASVVLDRLASHGIPVVRTDHAGRITFVSDGRSFTLRR